MKPLYLAALLLPLAGLPAWAESAPQAAPPDEVVAEQGALKLTAGQLQQMLQMVVPEQRGKLLADHSALDNFVRDRVMNLALLAEAQAKGFDQNPQVKARAQAAYDSVVVQSYLSSLVPADAGYPTDGELSQFYQANRDKLLQSKQYHLAQIVVLVPPNASAAAQDAARKKAEELRGQAVRRGSDFAELARRQSQDQASAARGGDIGTIGEDKLIPAIREALEKLPQGGISEPLRTPDGWHVVKLLGTVPAGPAPFAQVRPQLTAAMRQARVQGIVTDHVRKLAQKEPIQLNEIAIDRVAAQAR